MYFFANYKQSDLDAPKRQSHELAFYFLVFLCSVTSCLIEMETSSDLKLSESATKKLPVKESVESIEHKDGAPTEKAWPIRLYRFLEGLIPKHRARHRFHLERPLFYQLASGGHNAQKQTSTSRRHSSADPIDWPSNPSVTDQGSRICDRCSGTSGVVINESELIAAMQDFIVSFSDMSHDMANIGVYGDSDRMRVVAAEPRQPEEMTRSSRRRTLHGVRQERREIAPVQNSQILPDIVGDVGRGIRDEQMRYASNVRVFARPNPQTTDQETQTDNVAFLQWIGDCVANAEPSTLDVLGRQVRNTVLLKVNNSRNERIDYYDRQPSDVVCLASMSSTSSRVTPVALSQNPSSSSLQTVCGEHTAVDVHSSESYNNHLNSHQQNLVPQRNNVRQKRERIPHDTNIDVRDTRARDSLSSHDNFGLYPENLPQVDRCEMITKPPVKPRVVFDKDSVRHCTSKNPLDKVTLLTIPSTSLKSVYGLNGAHYIIGQGSFGTVKLAIYVDESGARHEVAAKYFHDGTVDDITKEAKVQAYLHPTGYVPRVFGMLRNHNTSDTGLVMVQEMIGEGKTLVEYINMNIGHVSRTCWIKICQEMTTGLQNIHAMNTLVNDLKEDNIILDLTEPDRPMVRFIDMGHATVARPLVFDYDSTYLETFVHIAPEVRHNQPSSIASDVYSLGRIFMYIGAGQKLRDVYNLGGECMQVDISERPTVAYIHKQLERISLDVDFLNNTCVTGDSDGVGDGWVRERVTSV